jgi:hypothetical protein
LCVALYFVDLSSFAFLPFVTKSAVVGSLITLPMLFSGLIFIDSFSKVKEKNLALGANLMGALVGGVLQSVTFLIGIKALLLLVAGLYTVALLTKPEPLAKTPTNPETDSEQDRNVEQLVCELLEISDRGRLGNTVRPEICAPETICVESFAGDSQRATFPPGTQEV